MLSKASYLVTTDEGSQIEMPSSPRSAPLESHSMRKRGQVQVLAEDRLVRRFVLRIELVINRPWLVVWR
jgi:hypothetical protein